MQLVNIKRGVEPMPLLAVKPQVKVKKSAVSCPEGLYRCIVADPPWNTKKGCDWNSNGKSNDLDYPTMTVQEIAQLEVPADKNAVIFIWTINKYVPHTYVLAKKWGFTPSQLLTWCKTPRGIGLGGTFTPCTEFVLMAKKGTIDAKARCDRSWWKWERERHSKKPEDFQKMLMKMFDGPYLEMFARRRKPGWATWGNEL